MCYLEVVAYGATVVGTLIATATLVYTILTYKRASRIELVIPQRKELLQCDGVKKILIENEYSVGKADKLIQKFIQDINQVATDWENSIEEKRFERDRDASYE